MIKLITVRPRDETRQMAYFMVDEYDFSDGRIPAALNTDTKVLAWLGKNEDFYMFLILQKMYRDDEIWADWQRFKTDKNTDLEAFQEWIKKGCKNKLAPGKYHVIKKQPWHSTHPKELMLMNDISEAKTIPDIKKILVKMVDNF